MKLGIMQPYIFPYLGYFQLIGAVDKYVIYDDVNYIRSGWINRNYIIVNRRQYLFTICIDHASPFKLINELTIKDDFVKLSKTIELAYKKAPYFTEAFAL
ncbi:MAG: WbqC family protein, partial [Candidatus Omnitrophica bacterium]|nr:WbqC family protein [Candidatus Omnitrophota bacterium]